MTVAEYVLKFLISKKVSDVFLITGGAISLIVDEFSRNKKIDKILSKVLNSKKPEFINVIINPNQKIIPKLQFGNPIEDLSPLLSRSEFKKNMMIPILKRKFSDFSEAN